MPTDKSKPKQTTGKPVRDIKGDATKDPASNQAQVHAGNIPVLHIRLLDQLVHQTKRIADALEKNNG